MAIVTISREFGSNGNTIGKLVANALGYQFVFKQELSLVFKEYGLPRIDELYQTTANFWKSYDTMNQAAIELLVRSIRAFAKRDNIVIVGRGSYAILGGLSDVFNVRIQAPMSYKAEQIVQQKLATPDKVEELIKREDETRRRFVEVNFGSNWYSTTNFDLTVDVSKVSESLAVEWIVSAIKGFSTRKPGKGPDSKSLEVDPILSHTVEAILNSISQA